MYVWVSVCVCIWLLLNSVSFGHSSYYFCSRYVISAIYKNDFSLKKSAALTHSFEAHCARTRQNDGFPCLQAERMRESESKEINMVFYVENGSGHIAVNALLIYMFT